MSCEPVSFWYAVGCVHLGGAVAGFILCMWCRRKDAAKTALYSAIGGFGFLTLAAGVLIEEWLEKRSRRKRTDAH